MKKTAVALLALTVAGSSALAYDFAGFYLGGNVGQTQYHKTVRLSALNDKGEFDKAATEAFNRDNTKTKGLGYGLHMGYHVTDYFGVELGWTKFSTNEYSFDRYNAEGKKLASEKLFHRANAVDLVGKFNYFNDLTNLNFFAGAGVAYVKSDLSPNFFVYNTANSTAKEVDTHYRWSPVLTAGVEYYFTPSFSVGAEAKYFMNVVKSPNQDFKIVKTEDSYKKEDVKESFIPKHGLVGAEQSLDPKATEETKKVVTSTLVNNNHRYKPSVLFLSANANYHFGRVAPVVAPEVVTIKFEVKAEALFATNKYDLNMPQAAAKLADVVKAYQNDESNATVKVVGHADRTGNPQYNIKLSEKRAQAVGNYLVSQGVSTSRLSVSGVGSTQPVTNGCYNVKNRKALRECLAPDRRVDVFVSGLKTKMVK